MFTSLVRIFLLHFPGTELGDILAAVSGLTAFLPNQLLLNFGPRKLSLCPLISDLVRLGGHWGVHLCFSSANDRVVKEWWCSWGFAVVLPLFATHSYTVTKYAWTHRSKWVTRMIHLWAVGHYLLLTHLEQHGQQTVICSMLLHFCAAVCGSWVCVCEIAQNEQ